MVKSNLNWHGDDALKAIMDAAWESILRATILFWTELQKVLSRKSPPPSPAGQPPGKITGWGSKHVQYELDKPKLTTRVGLLKNAIYLLFLELGATIRPKNKKALSWIDQASGKRVFRKKVTLLPRPWFLVTLKRLMPQLTNVIGQTKVG